MEAIDSSSRKDRKKEGRNLKRQRIEAAGGVRPRQRHEERDGGGSAAQERRDNVDEKPSDRHSKGSTLPTAEKERNQSTDKVGQGQRRSSTTPAGAPGEGRSKAAPPRPAAGTANAHPHPRRDRQNPHRFGRVMDQPPCPNQPRSSTLSIAIPGSVVANCQTRELKTTLVGQIARAATIYHVDEIVVYDDHLAAQRQSARYGFKDGRCGGGGGGRDARSSSSAAAGDGAGNDGDKPPAERGEAADRPAFSADPHAFMARLLQYCECPQYLRRHFFPMHPDLQFAGLLPPMDAPHHVRAEDRAPYREGVVLDAISSNGKSLVYCGIRNRSVEIDARLTPGIRCTVQIDPAVYTTLNGSATTPIPGKVVSPSTPRETSGTYWGYTTRLAAGIKAVLDECPYGAYDLSIGTSERGTKNLDQADYSVPAFKHALVVFGGVAGIEECVDADESLKISGSMSYTLFDQWVNICPYQGSRTIRTEEAVLIGLAKLSPILSLSMSSTGSHQVKQTKGKTETRKVIADTPPVGLAFSDSEPSDESSNSDED